jgi:DNA primase
LWQAELAARPIDTPERRADLEKRLMAQAGLIADRAVQSEYRRFLRDRLFELTRGRAASRTAARPRPVRPDFAPDFAPPRPPGRLHREVFLGMLLRHPPLIEEWVEEIAAVAFPEPELDSLRRAILEIANTHPGLDANPLRQHLALCGHAETLGALAITIAKHAGFAARGGDDPEVIKQGLRETLQLLHGQAPGDIEAARLAFAADPSVENSERLRALKERQFADGPIGGIES